MRRLLLAAALALGATGARAAEEKTPSRAIAELLSFKAPKGWAVDEYANAGGADPVVRFENKSDALQIRVFGAPGSDYPAPEDFLAGAAASEAGTATVAGRKLALHRRRFALEIRDPHRPSTGKSPMGSETFCVLPLKKGRYAVLAYRRESPIPDLDRTGEKTWEAFLKTVRPKANR